VDDGRHDDPVGDAVAPEAIGDEAARDTAAPHRLEQLAKEPRGGVTIPAKLEQDVEPANLGRPKIAFVVLTGATK